MGRYEWSPLVERTDLAVLARCWNGDKDDNWRAALTETLIQLGYPELDIERVIAPKFAHALKDWDETDSNAGPDLPSRFPVSLPNRIVGISNIERRPSSFDLAAMMAESLYTRH